LGYEKFGAFVGRVMRQTSQFGFVAELWKFALYLLILIVGGLFPYFVYVGVSFVEGFMPSYQSLVEDGGLLFWSAAIIATAVHAHFRYTSPLDSMDFWAILVFAIAPFFLITIASVIGIKDALSSSAPANFSELSLKYDDRVQYVTAGASIAYAFFVSLRTRRFY
jgi:hypothetical protein